jgi:hypothetical protein
MVMTIAPTTGTERNLDARTTQRRHNPETLPASSGSRRDRFFLFLNPAIASGPYSVPRPGATRGNYKKGSSWKKVGKNLGMMSN